MHSFINALEEGLILTDFVGLLLSSHKILNVSLSEIIEKGPKSEVINISCIFIFGYEILQRE